MLLLGKFFEQRKSFFSYTAMDIYNIAADFFKQEFALDTIIHQLLAIDYYLQHKIKPAEKFITEINKKDKFSLLEQLKLPHQKNRYVVVSIDFNYTLFKQNNCIEQQPQFLIIEYTGTQLPKVIEATKTLQLIK